MKLPVMQFWDSRLLYIYALLSGYVQADQEKLQDLLNTFINYPDNQEYCSALLEKLATEAKIESTENAAQSADTIWFKDMVRSYVDYFQTNRMFAPTGNSITLYAQHEARLLNKLGTSSTAREIKGNQSSNSKKFLETLLALAAKGFIIIESIKATDETCQQFLAMVSRTENVPDDKEEVAVTKIEGTQIYIGIKGKEPVPLGSPLRFDSPAYNFMRYMELHSHTAINRNDIQENVEGCMTKKDMTELVRAARFDKELKKIFFEGTTKSSVRFTPTKTLSGNELKAYKYRLNAIRD
jgi:hypothetical protein